uniref:four and a half LIM domains protein 2-like n=1 Tax=Myxine glutinosa TaxID=7769 RepID=UPI00358E5764
MTEVLDCESCGKSLLGSQYAAAEDKPYCLPCHDSLFASICEECQKSIGCGSKDMVYEDRHWHEQCFTCSFCHGSLAGKPFLEQDGKLVCSQCYCSELAARCQVCSKPIPPGSQRMEYEGQVWHNECFLCQKCNRPIGTQSFFPREDGNYCNSCYEAHVAMRCAHCKKPITEAGVRYRNEPWHRECFVCQNCHKALSGEKFATQENLPYCTECHTQLFAKRCHGCGKPIAGPANTKYVTFEDKEWHSDCFCCSLCGRSLLGQGFLPVPQGLACPECGNNVKAPS